jgi:hypothetical protein
MNHQLAGHDRLAHTSHYGHNEGWIKCAHFNCSQEINWKGMPFSKVEANLLDRKWENIGFFWLCPTHVPEKVSE